jgi:hypothetical protein
MVLFTFAAKNDIFQIDDVYYYRWGTKYQTLDGSRMRVTTKIDRKYEEWTNKYFLLVCTGEYIIDI